MEEPFCDVLAYLSKVQHSCSSGGSESGDGDKREERLFHHHQWGSSLINYVIANDWMEEINELIKADFYVLSIKLTE